jgi:hypothetical protein
MGWRIQSITERLVEQYGGYGQAHKTAIARRGASAPVKYLINKGLLVGRILDHGCGKGDICKFTDIQNAEQWDPTWHPQRPLGLFDTVYSGFVLNTMPEEARHNVLSDIRRFLAPGGTAYIAIRRDIKQEGVTRTGSEQYNATLPFPRLVEVPGKYIIYTMRAV